MWSTGNFIKGDFPLALVIALRINIFLASRMDGLHGSFFWGGMNKMARDNLAVIVLPLLSTRGEAASTLSWVLHIFHYAFK